MPKFLVMRIILASVLALEAALAFSGGIYGLKGAPDVPTEWLRGTPFEDYTIPSLILMIVVGGSAGLAAGMAFRSLPKYTNFARLAALILMFWIAVQIAIIGLVSLLQPAMFAVGMAIWTLAHLADTQRSVAA